MTKKASTHWAKTDSKANGLGKPDSYVEKNGSAPLFHTMYKIKLKMDSRLTCKT